MIEAFVSFGAHFIQSIRLKDEPDIFVGDDPLPADEVKAVSVQDTFKHRSPARIDLPDESYRNAFIGILMFP